MSPKKKKKKKPSASAREFVEAAPSAPAPQDAATRIHDAEVARLKRRLEEVETGQDVIRRVVEELYERPADLVVPAAPKAGRGAEEVAVLHISDTQIGKRTATYDTSVAQRRLHRLVELTLKVTELRRQAAKITRLVLLVGGDIVEGELIFPAQAHQIDSSVLEQAVRAAPSILTECVVGLLSGFETIETVCVSGNHGRPANKHAGSHPLTNWDRVCYDVLRVQLLGTDGAPNVDVRKRVTVDVVDGWHRVIRLPGGWGILLIHGDQIRGGFAGYPWYAVGRKAEKWRTSIREPWDYLYLGHFHTAAAFSINDIEVRANGTTESDNEYARAELGASGAPQQRLSFFTERHGLVSESMLHLSDERTPLARRFQ